MSSAEIRNKVIPYILEEIKPKVVFDLGMGSGLYGAFILHSAPETVLIGLDGWLPYFQTEFARVYTARIHTPIEMVMSGDFPIWGDLVICMDVVEHFPKDKALKLLAILKDLPQPAIVSTPLFDYPQGPVLGNPFEEHQCWFSEKELNGLGFHTLFKEWYEGADGPKGYIGAFIC